MVSQGAPKLQAVRICISSEGFACHKYNTFNILKWFKLCILCFSCAGRLQRKVARGDEDPGEGSDSLSSLLAGTRWADGNPNVVEEMQASSSALEGSLDSLYEKRYAISWLSNVLNLNLCECEVVRLWRASSFWL